MKTLTILLLCLLPIHWEPDFDSAKQAAALQHKLILLNFSGSDWCGPCILFRKNYLENEDFTKFADTHLILVNADFPRKKKNMASAEIIKKNEALAERYNKDGNFPLTLLMDADGKILKTWRGVPDISAAQWTSELETYCHSN